MPYRYKGGHITGIFQPCLHARASNESKLYCNSNSKAGPIFARSSSPIIPVPSPAAPPPSLSRPQQQLHHEGGGSCQHLDHGRHRRRRQPRSRHPSQAPQRSGQRPGAVERDSPRSSAIGREPHRLVPRARRRRHAFRAERPVLLLVLERYVLAHNAYTDHRVAVYFGAPPLLPRWCQFRASQLAWLPLATCHVGPARTACLLASCRFAVVVVAVVDVVVVAVLLLWSSSSSSLLPPGCAIGCETCDGSSRGPIPSSQDPSWRRKFNLCNTTMQATICDPALRTVNRGVECGADDDW
jgi:hypothetical protein